MAMNMPFSPCQRAASVNTAMVCSMPNRRVRAIRQFRREASGKQKHSKTCATSPFMTSPLSRPPDFPQAIQSVYWDGNVARFGINRI
jgi:hypothetical protein